MSTISRRGRSRVAVFAVVAVLASLLALPLPAGAATAACPDSIPSAGFTDMAGYSTTAQDAVDCIFAYGVTAGVDTGLYGPAQNVPRWQMAIFLWKVLVAGGATIDTSSFGFTDIGAVSATGQGAINAIANAGISVGKGGGVFAPMDNVTRVEMAFFLAATLKELGVTVDTSAFGFTDIAGQSAAAQDAINTVANAGVSAGTGGGLFEPTALTTRVQMAMFLAAEMDEAGIVPAGSVNIVTDSASPDFWYADANAGKEVKVTTKSTHTFWVDGTSASQGVFFLNASVGDTVQVTGTTYKLTNVSASSYKSGYLDNPDETGQSFDVVEPITGTVLNSLDYTATASFTLFQVDGTAASEGTFFDGAQAGDMVSWSGTGADASHLRTISLTNKTVVDEITVTGAATDHTFTVGAFAQEFDADDADDLTIDGDAAVIADWEKEASDCDQVTLTYAAGLLDIAMVNCALGSGDGVATGNAVTYAAGPPVLGSIEVDFSTVGWADGNIAYADVDAYLVDGSLVTPTEFQAKITPGDLIKWTPKDGDIVKKSSLALTNVAGLAAVEVFDVDTTNNDIWVIWDDLESAPIDYELTANVGLSGSAIVYQINGVDSADLAEWEADTQALVDAPSIDPTLTISVAGGKIVYNVES